MCVLVVLLLAAVVGRGEKVSQKVGGVWYHTSTGRRRRKGVTFGSCSHRNWVAFGSCSSGNYSDGSVEVGGKHVEKLLGGWGSHGWLGEGRVRL